MMQYYFELSVVPLLNIGTASVLMHQRHNIEQRYPGDNVSPL